jgi:hypothetical protein
VSAPVSTPQPSAIPSPGGRVEHATGSRDVVLRFDSSPDYAVSELTGELFQPGPEFTLYGDGTVIFRRIDRAQPPVVEGPVLRASPFLIARLDEDQVQALLTFALGDGGLASARARYEAQGADALGSTTFTIHAGGFDKRVEVVGAVAPFEALVDHLLTLDRSVGLTTRVWTTDRSWGLLVKASWLGRGLAPPPPGTRAVPWPWRDIGPSSFAGLADPGSGFEGRRVLSTAQAAVLGLSGGGGVVQRVYLEGPNSTIYSFSLWPILPDDALGEARSGPQTSIPAPATPAATPRPTSVPTYAATLAWSQDYLPRPPGDAMRGGSNARASDITVGGPGLVIVGTDLDARGNEVAAAWTSTDGVAWQEHVTSIIDHPGYAFAAVAAGGDALVAVGRQGIWWSSDGVTWEQVGEPAIVGTHLTDIAWGPAGFVAVAADDGGVASTWRSSDGRSWEPGALTTALSGLCPTKIAGGSKGYLVVGSNCGDPSRPVIASSPDGRSWIRAPGQSSLFGEGEADGAIAGGPGWIAFGRFRPDASANAGDAVWTSTDGRAWRRTSFLRPLPPCVPDCGNPGGAIADVAAFGPGYVAVGMSWCGNDQWGAAWASSDGATWHSVRLDPMTDARFWLLRAVAAYGGRLVAAAGGPWVDHLPAAVSAVLAP